MLTLQGITLSQGNKVLLRDVSLNVYEKQKIGLVGHNGCGKSSLFSLLRGELTPDQGECSLNAHAQISHLSQQLPDTSISALDFVLGGDTQYQAIQARLQRAESNQDDEEIMLCHALLSQSGGYSKPAKAATILAGLGFSTVQQQAAVNSFSGGWRMRLSLGRCLMCPADLLLLDEPTNHLDMEAIFWLEKWLKHLSCSVIIISHDREFLDACVTHIVHISQQTLQLYTGNYSVFERARAAKFALQCASYTKQQAKIQHMMAFVQRFKAKATKAKQAQSRLKAIAKLEIIAQAQADSSFAFDFFPVEQVGKPLLQCEQVTVGYAATTPVLKKVNLQLNPGDRIALLGPNGEGKSTLIKTLTGVLPTLSGQIAHAAKLKVGYYAQHQLEQLDCALSPLETIQRLSPDAREQTIRDYLGGFQFVGDAATQSIVHFSGGEKARLALAKLVWLRPNLLLLDEPTNHLDLSMRAAIEIALQSYEGALILISHDRHLLRTTVDDFYLVHSQQVSAWKGDLEDYHQWLLTRELSQTQGTDGASNAYREKRTLQNRLKKLEQITQDYQKECTEIESALADPALYGAEHQPKLQALLAQRDKVQKALFLAEEEWLEVMTSLEMIQ